MISSYYPYPVNDIKSPARRPHIYSPSSPRIAMYPHLHVSACPSPSYFYSGYEQYQSKDAWPNTSSWSTFYPHPPRHDVAVNPKVTILPSQPVLVSDIDTPSSISSHSVLTPSSPFAQHDMGEEPEFQSMEFDEFEYEDDEDFIDSDFADEMEGIVDEAPSPPYGATSVPQAIKSASALAGALGDVPSSSSYDSSTSVSAPADRRLSASVPGYGSGSHRSTVSSHQRWPEKGHSPVPLTSSPHVVETSYPSQHTYTQRNYASSSSSLYNSSSSLAGAFAPSVPTSHASRHASQPLPILQPQPVRPIPPIPLADLTSSANESSRSPEPRTEHASHPSRTTLSPLPLLCQPVSDVVRYQLKEPPASDSHPMDDEEVCYEQENNAPASVCEDLLAASETDGFAQQGIMFCQELPHHHSSATGTCSMVEKLYSSSGCGTVGLPIRWH